MTVLEDYSTMDNLLNALASCTGMPISLMTNSRGMNRGPRGLLEPRFDTDMSFNIIGDPVTVGDTLLQLLLTLAQKASSVDLLLSPVFGFLISCESTVPRLLRLQ